MRKNTDFYFVYSDNPERRKVEHNTDVRNTYTSKHRPWQLVTAISVGKDRGYAMRVERYIKRLKSRRIIE